MKDGSLSFENCRHPYLFEGLRVTVEVSTEKENLAWPKVQGRLFGGDNSLTMVLEGALPLARPRKEARMI